MKNYLELLGTTIEVNTITDRSNAIGLFRNLDVTAAKIGNSFVHINPETKSIAIYDLNDDMAFECMGYIDNAEEFDTIRRDAAEKVKDMDVDGVSPYTNILTIELFKSDPEFQYFAYWLENHGEAILKAKAKCFRRNQPA